MPNTKHTRALSSGDIADYEVMQRDYYKNSPDRPIHRLTQSLFCTSSGFTNFRGLVNLGSFLLLITTGRMALENVLKYGIVMDPFSWIRFLLNAREKFFAIGLVVCSNVFILFSCLLECARVRGLVGSKLHMFLTLWNLTCLLAVPTVVIWSLDFNPLFSAPLLSFYTIVFLKLWSYAAVNHWCRTALLTKTSEGDDDLFRPSKQSSPKPTNESTTKSSDKQDSPGVGNHTGPDQTKTQGSGDTDLRHRFQNKDQGKVSINNFKQQSHQLRSRLSVVDHRPDPYSSDPVENEVNQFVSSTQGGKNRPSYYITYPNNLTLKDIYYFMFAPTLCYELNFPRTLQIRKPFLLRRLFELVFIPQLILCMIQQWVLPILQNSLVPFAESNWSQVFERCLKLAIPNHFIWLLLFYSMFHSFMNVLAEVLYFGDRFFYSDWWNAESIPHFWSKWNIPVHRFARRHIYVPLLKRGFTRFQAGMAVFFVSAFFHELLVSVPLKMPRLWAFWAMFSQMPYAFLVSYLFPKGGQAGNIAVWIALIIGQPLAILLYFHDYLVIHHTL